MITHRTKRSQPSGQVAVVAQTFAFSLVLAVCASPAQAHVSYADLGTFSGLASASQTVSNLATTGNYGWADAADTDWGDSHKGKWFTFTLQNAATVSFSVSAKADATTTSVGGFIPGFSLYAGLVPSVDPSNPTVVSKSYDSSAPTQAYRATLGFATEGAWNALGDFKMGNDAGALGSLTYIGYAADGVGAVGNGVGDGVADNAVSGSFALAAGTYTIIVGGANYAAQFETGTSLSAKYGLSSTLNVAAVPEPDTAALLVVGVAAMGVAARRRQR